MNDSSASWIRLYSEEGREIAYFVRTMAEHGYPVAVAVSPGGDLLCLSSLMVEDASVKTYISFYNFGSKGKDAVDHYVGGFDYPDEIFPVIRFIKNNVCIGISDSRLVYYEGSAAPKNGTNNLISEEIRGVYYSDQYIGLLFNDATGESQYRLDLYDSEGNRKHSVGITMDFTDLQINGDYIYINNDSELQIYTTGGRRIFDGSLGVSIRALIPSSRPRLRAIRCARQEWNSLVTMAAPGARPFSFRIRAEKSRFSRVETDRSSRRILSLAIPRSVSRRRMHSASEISSSSPFPPLTMHRQPGFFSSQPAAASTLVRSMREGLSPLT